MSDFILIEDASKCCGCGMCSLVCPNDSITMVEDKYGFKFPEINTLSCIKCGLCKIKCSYQNNGKLNSVEDVFLATASEDEILKKSSSGGVFATIAKNILLNEGIVYGCSLEMVRGVLTPIHIGIRKIEELKKIQGSKYIQSDLSHIFLEIKKHLNNNQVILFSGTPCQIDSLKSFLDYKDYGNLFLIDIICHGVPNYSFFKGYLNELEKKTKGKVTAFNFREKSKGWGLKGSYIYDDGKKEIKKLLQANLSSYYKLFLSSEIYRENCYTCKYACSNRVGDVTLGDFWGIEKEHPSYLVSNGGVFDEKKGVSCVLINSNNGRKLLERYGKNLIIKPSDLNKVISHNKQLKYPSVFSNNRQIILDLYLKDGYRAVEKWYMKNLGITRILYIIWGGVPYKIKKLLKK